MSPVAIPGRTGHPASLAVHAARGPEFSRVRSGRLPGRLQLRARRPRKQRGWTRCRFPRRGSALRSLGAQRAAAGGRAASAAPQSYRIANVFKTAQSFGWAMRTVRQCHVARHSSQSLVPLVDQRRVQRERSRIRRPWMMNGVARACWFPWALTAVAAAQTPAGGEFRQHLHDRPPNSCSPGDGAGRRLCRRLVQLRPGRKRLRGLRSAVRCVRGAAGQRLSDQDLYNARPAPARRRGRQPGDFVVGWAACLGLLGASMKAVASGNFAGLEAGSSGVGSSVLPRDGACVAVVAAERAHRQGGSP